MDAGGSETGEMGCAAWGRKWISGEGNGFGELFRLLIGDEINIARLDGCFGKQEDHSRGRRVDREAK